MNRWPRGALVPQSLSLRAATLSAQGDQVARTNTGGGTVVAVHDGLDGISTTLKYINYQLDTAGTGHEPHPQHWTASAGHFRSVLTKQAELATHLAAAIDRWTKAHRTKTPQTWPRHGPHRRT